MHLVRSFDNSNFKFDAEGLLSQPTDTTNPPYEAPAGAFAEALLQAEGFQTARQTVFTQVIGGQRHQRFNVLAEKGYGDQALLFFAHLDTLPQNTDWHSENQRYFFLDDRIYSPGVFHTTGGVIALLDSLKAINPQGFKVKVALLADGTGYQRGAYNLVHTSWLRDVTLALSPQPASDVDASDGSNTFAVWEQGKLALNSGNRFVALLKDYVQDYIGPVVYKNSGSMYGTELLANHVSDDGSMFPVISLAPEGLTTTDEGEWVSISSLLQLSTIFRFVIEDFYQWLTVSR